MEFLELYESDAKFFVVGVDPGPTSSALCMISLHRKTPEIKSAAYWNNRNLRGWSEELDSFLGHRSGGPVFLCYEACGAQGAFVGASTFETAATGGEIRHLFRPHVVGTYQFSPADWRYLLCGRGNAKTPQVYEGCCHAFGEGTGGGSDPYRGVKGKPGQLSALYEAGKGNNMEHMKDALGVALAPTRSVFRTGEGPEKYRRAW